MPSQCGKLSKTHCAILNKRHIMSDQLIINITEMGILIIVKPADTATNSCTKDT